MRHKLWKRGLAILSVLTVSLTGVMIGQSNQGSIAGSVSDSTGAAVPHAAVTAKESGNRSCTDGRVVERGSYRFPAVSLGTYDVSVSVPGFKKASYSGVIVQVNTISTLDITLEVGSSERADYCGGVRTIGAGRVVRARWRGKYKTGD